MFVGLHLQVPFQRVIKTSMRVLSGQGTQAFVALLFPTPVCERHLEGGGIDCYGWKKSRTSVFGTYVDQERRQSTIISNSVLV